MVVWLLMVNPTAPNSDDRQWIAHVWLRYGEQVKPFNFLSTCHVRPFGHPERVRPERANASRPTNRVRAVG